MSESGILFGVQLGLPFGEARHAGADPRTILDRRLDRRHRRSQPIYFVRHRRARRYLLRVEFDGRVRVTIPRGGSRREADAFARRHVEWVAAPACGVVAAAAFPPTTDCGCEPGRRRSCRSRLHELAASHGLRVTHGSASAISARDGDRAGGTVTCA